MNTTGIAKCDSVQAHGGRSRLCCTARSTQQQHPQPATVTAMTQNSLRAGACHVDSR